MSNEIERLLDDVRMFIEREFSNPALEPEGEWLEKEARPIHGRICAAESRLASQERGTVTDEMATAFEGAMRQLTRISAAQYLLANTRYRGNGALKAHHHAELTTAYVAAFRNCDADRVRSRYDADYRAVHDATAEGITNRLDEAIGFDLDGYVDDAVQERFFVGFHRIAVAALATAEREGREKALEEAAQIADPPLMHRKGKPGLWRRRRAQIAADIRDLKDTAAADGRKVEASE